MSKIVSIRSLPAAEVVCRDLRGKYEGLAAIDSRHHGIPGWDQKKYSDSALGVIGAGGLNGENTEGCVRKGIGELRILDGDTVEVPNLNRQYFTYKDLGKNKAECSAYNLKDVGYMGTRLLAYPYFFQEAIEKEIRFDVDVIICGVDNDQTRVYVSKYGLEHNIPIVFSAVSEDGNNGYVFVQESGGPCFGCAFPWAIKNEKMPCPGVPAIKDILKVVSGFALYAVDTLLMERKRNWNYRMLFLAGFISDSNRLIKANPSCSLCGDDSKTGDSNGLD